MVISRRAFMAAALLSPAIGTLAGCRTTTNGPGPGTATARSAAPPRPGEDWRSYRDYLAERAAAGQFSGAVLVARDGTPVLQQAHGMADRQRRVANTVGTRFCTCSMGKMFTAVAIAQLVEQGRLSFEDTIAPYVSGYGFPSEIADHVTVAELLTHTAGTGDALQRTPTSQPPTTTAGLMKVIAATPLRFTPGSRFSYSNSGYIILGAVIEHVTGHSYAEHIRDRIFAPAGMTDTDIRIYTPADVPGMAHPYALVGEDGQPVGGGPPGSTPQPATLRDVADVPQIANPSGGAYSTVTDMHNFAQALTGHKLLGPALTRTLLAGKVHTADPARPPGDQYAYGFDDVTINGVRIVGHNGGSPGYEGQLDIYPDKGYVVVIMTNQDSVLIPAIRQAEDRLTR
jgi:CubicO group peptidase (beta-lactamase class C family)